jgi:uncharacterized protein
MAFVGATRLGAPDELSTMTGVGPLTRLERAEGPAATRRRGKNRLHFEAGKEPYVLLPIIP